MSHEGTRFRRARPDEAEAITELVLRSKRHWGYADEFIALMAPVMTFTREDLERPADRVEVLEADGRLDGVIRLRRRTELAFLEDLWLDPSVMGRGLGRRLFARAVEIARGWGKGVLEFESDPFAEPFYLHLGAQRVGMSPSTTLPGRAVPLMRFALREPAPTSRG
jgi:GNAT superfamily N-acetyltransferase